MARPKLIPEDCIEEVLKRIGSGESSDDIAKSLSERLGRKVDGRRVRALHHRIRQERGPIAKQIAEQVVAEKTTADLEGVQEQITAANGDERAARDGAKTHEVGSLEWKRCMDVVHASAMRRHQSYELHFKLSGATGGADGDGGVVVLPPEED
jgi:hypothetical protein